MIDEEMAEEYAIGRTYPRFETDYIAKFVLREVEGAFLAGLKAGRPQWHDLRKDPNDLPKKEDNYIVCYIDTTCERHSFELGFSNWYGDKHWIDEEAEGFDEGVIAWCEIPTFDKE